jgi:MYXO-CTERM domain-containing protein
MLASAGASTGDLRAAASELAAKVTTPLDAALGDAEEIFLSPEGQLHLVPFEALVNGSGRFLVEGRLFTYLTSGRELLRPHAQKASDAAAEIFANPDFEGGGSGEALGSGGRRGVSGEDLARVRFTPLPGTGAEAVAIERALGKARVHSAGSATKSALFALHGPSLLHVATHGFFLADHEAASGGTRGLELASAGPELDASPESENPLLRSGLALAGANVKGERRSDGILTALEASGLDLAGTQLVVLSACETGLGDVNSGEGVVGLRRALAISGAETEVMSLWKVDDDATAKMMKGYYERIVHGGGRSNAMRDERLAMLADPATAHPYYWASFIVSGDPDSLGAAHVGMSRAAPPPLPKVPPMQGGCACEAGGAGAPEPAAAFAFGGALALVLARRRRRSIAERDPAP